MEKFRIARNGTDVNVPIRIELYSFEDMHKLASDRNAVFFRLQKSELEVNNDSEILK